MTLAEGLSGFQSAKPFPHAVLEHFIDADTIRAINQEWPTDPSQWKEHHHQFSQKRGTRGPFGPTTASVIEQLNAPDFVDALASVTGIENLSADPGLFGGGLHESFTGGFLGIHADFNLHPETRYTRRLNLLLFLNEEWPTHWGGNLELQNRVGSMRVVVPPTAGRCVIFETSRQSFHGHPSPLMCPEDKSRRSMALYYYTPSNEPVKSHSTLYLGDEKNWPEWLQ